MLKKVLTKAGRRIFRAIKRLSTKSRMAKKSQNSEIISAISWSSTVPDHEAMSLSWSLLSLDTKSVDTYVTYILEIMDEDAAIIECCCCTEHEENQRNENRENEMIT